MCLWKRDHRKRGSAEREESQKERNRRKRGIAEREKSQKEKKRRMKERFSKTIKCRAVNISVKKERGAVHVEGQYLSNNDPSNSGNARALQLNTRPEQM